MAYVPAPVPENLPANVQQFLREELRRIQIQFTTIDNLNLNPRAAEPTRYSDGMVVYANGTDWDPGSGAGFYGREAGAWVKL